jgi:FKBP-type peptidyl-prolyl cis-trans isomerase
MNMNVRNLLVGISASVLILSSCNEGPDVPDELATWYAEVAKINSDLAAAGINATKDPESGISMIITKLGTGLPAQINYTMDVDYIGRRYEDKVVFDQGNTKLQLSKYIEGWKVAFSKLPEGSEAKLIIPSLYGYRTEGNGPNIPGNTILEFDVKFNKATMSSTEAAKLGSDTVAIDTYLTGKGINAVKDTTGLRYVITAAGAGSPATWYSKITMKYTIKLMSDDTKALVTVERQPSDTYFSRPVDYIQGMKIGLQKLSIGSKAVLYIPSTYAFGAESVSDPNTGVTIPANSNIIVEVEVLNIQ